MTKKFLSSLLAIGMLISNQPMIMLANTDQAETDSESTTASSISLDNEVMPVAEDPVVYENAVKCFGYGETRQDAIKELAINLLGGKEAEIDPEQLSSKITSLSNGPCRDWIDQVMFILFDKKLEKDQTISFTVSNGDVTHKDTCLGGDTGDQFNLFAWSFRDKGQTKDSYAKRGAWTLKFTEDTASKIDLSKEFTINVANLPAGEDIVHFAKLTGIDQKDEDNLSVNLEEDGVIGQHYVAVFNTKNLSVTKPEGNIAENANLTNAPGYYIGWALERPNDKVTQYSIAFGKDIDSFGPDSERTNVEPDVIGNKSGLALYFEANKPKEDHKFARVTWYGNEENGTTSHDTYGTTIIEVNFDGVTYLPEGLTSINTATGGAGFKADKAQAETAMNELAGKYDSEDSTWQYSSPVTDNTLWGLFELEVDDSASNKYQDIEYVAKVSKYGKTVVMESGKWAPENALLLNYGFNDLQQKGITPGEGIYEIELAFKDANGKELPIANQEVSVYKVAFDQGYHGTIDEYEDQYATYVDAQNIDNFETPTVTASTGYKFKGWSEPGTAEDYVITYTAEYENNSSNSSSNSRPSSGTGTGGQVSEEPSTEILPDGSTQTTTKNPDGSTTTVTENKDKGFTSTKVTQEDGSSVEDIVYADTSTEKIETAADQSKKTTKTDPYKTETVVEQDKNGNITSASASISDQAVEKATKNTTPVELQLPAIPADHTANDVALDITLPEGTGDIEVAIPVEKGNPGSVAMIEDENGELVPIKESLVDENGKLIVPLDGSKKIVIKDNSKAFSDMPGYDKTSYPGEGVAYVSARKIFNGNEDGSFNLNGNVTRGMLARVLYNLEGNPSVAGLPVPAGVAIPWYKDASAWAANKKLMAQGSDFRGEDLLTREQLAMILWREQGKPAAKGDISVYDPEDVASISSPEMLEAVSWAVGEHIIGQNSPLNGQKESTRGEVANMLYRFLTKTDGSK